MSGRALLKASGWENRENLSGGGAMSQGALPGRRTAPGKQPRPEASPPAAQGERLGTAVGLIQAPGAQGRRKRTAHLHLSGTESTITVVARSHCLPGDP